MRRFMLGAALASLAFGAIADAGPVCWSNGVGVGGVGLGTFCTDTPAPASLTARTQTSNVTVSGDVAGIPIGTTGVIVAYTTPPVIRIAILGHETYVAVPAPSPSPSPSPDPEGFTVCWHNGIGVDGAGLGTACRTFEGGPDGEVNLRTQTSNITVWGRLDDRAFGPTGIVIGYTVPPSVRVMVDGKEHYLPPP